MGQERRRGGGGVRGEWNARRSGNLVLYVVHPLLRPPLPVPELPAPPLGLLLLALRLELQRPALQQSPQRRFLSLPSLLGALGGLCCAPLRFIEGSLRGGDTIYRLSDKQPNAVGVSWD